MAKKKLFTREFFIGAIGITALLVIYFLINFFKGIDLFKVGETYYVRFSDVSQLVGSSPVYLNGYKAGNVRSINCDFNQIDNIIVEIEVDKRIKIPKGSTARITTHMLGGADLGIILSNNNEILAPGDTIIGTLDKGIAGEAADKIMPAFNAIMPKVDSVLTSLNTILANPSLTSSLSNVEQMTGELATATASLNALLSNDVPQITSRMIELENDMLTVSSQLSDVDYKQLTASIENTLNNIQQLTTALNNGEGTMGLLLKDSTLYNNLNGTCKAATELLQNLREDPKRYVHFSVFGRKK